MFCVTHRGKTDPRLDGLGCVNGGVRTCHWGGAKVDHFGARALERVALI